MSQSPIDDPMLLGYLLGSLDDADSRRVEEAIVVDDQLRGRLEELNVQFASLIDAANYGTPEPRGDLADRTLKSLKPCSERSRLKSQQGCTRLGWLVGPMADEDVGAESATGRSGLFRNMLELSAFSLSLIVLGSLTLSWALHAQEGARQQKCSFQLSGLGLALQDFAYHDPRQVAPEIALSGPMSFAGVYAVHLNERQLLCGEDLRWCPGMNSDFASVVGGPQRMLPSTQQLMEASQEQRSAWQHWIGGSYAYNLGVFENNKYITPRFRSRSTFAIMGDAPMLVDGRFVWNSHGRNRCNVLYEDGHVRVEIVNLNRKNKEDRDHPYLNRNGELRAGCSCEDSAMGPSYFRPLNNDDSDLKIRVSR